MAAEPKTSKVKYTGQSDVRKFMKGDWSTHFELEQDATEWNEKNHMTVELPEASAKALTEKLPNEFKIVTD